MGIETHQSTIHATLGPEFGEYFSKLVYDQCTALGFTLTEPMPTDYKAAVKWARANKKIQRQGFWKLEVRPPRQGDTYYVGIWLFTTGGALIPLFQFHEDGTSYVSYPFRRGLFKGQPEALAVMQRFVAMVAQYVPTQIET